MVFEDENKSLEITYTNHIRKMHQNNILEYFRTMRTKGGEPKKMEMSPKDRLTILAMSITGMIVLLLIAYDPLNILDTTQKWIVGLIVAVANVPLLWYQANRIKNKTKQ